MRDVEGLRDDEVDKEVRHRVNEGETEIICTKQGETWTVSSSKN